MLSAAPYIFAEINLGRWTLTPGFRFEPTVIDGSLRLPHTYAAPDVGYRRMDLPRNPDFGPLAWMPNPRLSLAYRATRKLTFTAGGGIYGQPPAVEDLSPVFGNPNLHSSSAIHASGGASYKLTGTLTLEAVGFYKRLYDLAARSGLPSPPVGQSLEQTGIGRSYGGQALLRQELAKGFFGWFSYSLIRSERKDRSDSNWRLFDYDQTHVLALLASYEITRGFLAGARFRYTTGAPRTPVDRSLLQHHRSAVRTHLRGAELDPHSRILFARRAGGEGPGGPASEVQRLRRRAECDQSEEPRGNHLQCRLQPAQLHHGVAGAGGSRGADGVLMKPANIGAMVLLVLLSACKPEVGPPISLINGPAILAVKGEPAEVDPKAADPTVQYEALAVDVGGRVPAPAPTADISSPILWSICDQPKPPTQSNSVSSACLDQNALPGVTGDSLDTYSAPAPSDSCTLFGPEIPPPVGDQPPIRPRDPDVTGGYYLPVRLSLSVPEGLRRVGMATEDSIVAFQLQRIYCGLANAPGTAVIPVRKSVHAQPEPGDRLVDAAAARF